MFFTDVYMVRVAISREGMACPTLSFSFFFRKVFQLLSLRPTGISIWTYTLGNGYYLVVGVGIFRV